MRWRWTIILPSEECQFRCWNIGFREVICQCDDLICPCRCAELVAVGKMADELPLIRWIALSTCGSYAFDSRIIDPNSYHDYEHTPTSMFSGENILTTRPSIFNCCGNGGQSAVRCFVGGEALKSHWTHVYSSDDNKPDTYKSYVQETNKCPVQV